MSVALAQEPPPVEGPDTSAVNTDDPGETDNPAGGDDKPFDTKYTPVAKDGAKIAWSQIAGAVHPSATKPPSYDDTVQNRLNPVPATVDFYTVSFANPDNGFAGGAQCKEEPTGADAEEPGLTDYLDKCERVPVIYRFTNTVELGPLWREAYRGETPGFVGAISWLNNQDKNDHGPRALAVGGTGSPSESCPKAGPDGKPRTDCPGYPRREPAVPDAVADRCRLESVEDPVDPDGERPLLKLKPGFGVPDLVPGTIVADAQAKLANCEDAWRREQDLEHGAGKGRTWLFSDYEWQERDAPKRMRGMTALAASLDPTDCPGATKECAMAGALQQIWIWSGNAFDPVPYEPAPLAERADRAVATPDRKLSGNVQWRFRVRAIRFLTRIPGDAEVAYAVTGGCCTTHPNPDMAVPRQLNYHRPSATWGLRLLTPYGGCGAPITGVGINDFSDRPVCGPESLPDSLYAVLGSRKYLVTPGGPERAGEPPSQIVGPAGGDYPVLVDNPGGAVSDATHHWASSARLVAADGDFQGHQLSSTERLAGLGSIPDQADNLFDWAVGGFKKTQRAVAYTTTTQTDTPGNLDFPFPLVCPGEFLDGSTLAPNTATSSAPDCKPNEKAAEQAKSGYLFKLSSYFLNGFALVGSSGVGWAVGDRGAIERLAGNTAAAAGTLRPERAPKLGARQPGSAPAREPYRAAAPIASAEPGTVPPREAAVPEALGTPRTTPYGSANPEGEPIDQIVMSRDGSEGWAIGPPASFNGRPQTTLYRFDGTRWGRCPTDSVEGVMNADPACEALWPLRHATPSPPKLIAIARVPMEYGDDPAKADDFDVVAAREGVRANGRPLLRYSEGRWTLDKTSWFGINGVPQQPSAPVTDIAFASPDDGWLVLDGGTYEDIYRFDGSTWTACAGSLGGPQPNVNVDRCEDRDRLIPTNLDLAYDLHLTSAGRRIYLYGHRKTASRATHPVILYKDPGSDWKQAYDPGCARREPDPTVNDPNRLSCAPNPGTPAGDVLSSLSVALAPDGSYNGWGIGNFGADDLPVGAVSLNTTLAVRQRDKGSNETPLIHSEGDDGTSWAPRQVDEVANDYLLPRKTTQTMQPQASTPRNVAIAALPGPGGRGGVVASRTGSVGTGPPVWLDPASGRWSVVPLPADHVHGGMPHQKATVAAIAPDNAGGVWLAESADSSEHESLFYRFSARARPEVFDDVAHPIREHIVAAAAGGDASFWVATRRGELYRYDRQTGWDRIAIPGWDPGRVVTNPSSPYAIAVGPDGSGVVVGKAGRIADIGAAGAVLNPAAGVLCAQAPPPCGTGRDLRAAAVAPDGSALVGGDKRALLYRDGGLGVFHAIEPPPIAVFAAITGVALPAPGRAFLVTDTGQIWAGTLEGSGWGWRQEDIDRFGDSISRDERKGQQPLRAIALDARGHGYAVGGRGTILERTGEGTPPWRRVSSEYLDELYSVTLGPGGRGALIGGHNGLVLTETGGGFLPARFADRFDERNWNFSTWGLARITGVALLPGYRDGQVEAWAVSEGNLNSQVAARIPPPDALLHYSSDPSEPLLDGNAARALPLADSPAPAADAVGFAAFGNSNCQTPAFGAAHPTVNPCPELIGSNAAHDVTARAVRDAILGAEARRAGPDFAVFTGDVADVALSRKNSDLPQYGGTNTPLDESPMHDRWRELIAGPLNDAGLPVFGALGERDLSELSARPYQYYVNSRSSRTGFNLGWRRSMAGMAAPWGAPGAPAARSAHELSFEPVEAGGTKLEPGDTTVEDPTEETLGGKRVEDPTKDSLGGKPIEDPTKAVGGTPIPGTNSTTPKEGAVGDRRISSDGVAGPQRVRDGGLVGDQTLPTGGARTHYAFDVKRGETPLVRVAVVDTSLRSLAASDGQQNPSEAQLDWLRRVLSGRPEGVRAVVVSNTPTYSYGPGATRETMTDATSFESLLVEQKVDMVVSGRMGWNGRYWAHAAGVHEPCPGAAYQDEPSPDAARVCDGPAAPDPTPAAGRAAGALSDTLRGLGAPLPPTPIESSERTGSAPVPFVVAHSAGGKFGPDGEDDGSGSEGYWRGYTVVHISPLGAHAPIVEQRPVFDWIGIRGVTHVLRPGQKTTLRGYGREPLGMDVGARYVDIDSPAITHRYDLLTADPAKPWLPKRDADGGYVALDPAVGTLDQQTGLVRAGRGNRERTFAIGLLSIGEKAATWPLAFEPGKSFRAKPAPVIPLPQLPRAPAPAPPQIRVLGQPPIPPPATPPPPGQLPNLAELNLPAPPALPPIPPSPAATPINPPPPPVPPSPPVNPPAEPLALNALLGQVGVNAAPIPPNAPAVNPAPPAGSAARKEAKQRQASVAKGEQGATDSAQELGGDLAQSGDTGPSAAMTRRDRTRPAPSFTIPEEEPGSERHAFTAMANREQPSAWARGALYGSGLTLAAAILALGFTVLRPTPRRRPPEVPAPAEARSARD